MKVSVIFISLGPTYSLKLLIQFPVYESNLNVQYGWVYRRVLVCIHNKIQWNYKKDIIQVVCHSLDGIEGYNAEWSKPEAR